MTNDPAPSAYLTTLASFVPSMLIREANDGAGAPTQARLTRTPAAVLFIDVAGFTALTETLAARGAAGAEDLTALLNLYLGYLIDSVTDRGGDIVKFAGDALIAVWPAQEDAPADAALRDAALRAVGCAMDIRSRLTDFEVAEGFRLRVKLAVGAGEVWSERLGGVFDRWELLIAGDALGQIGAAADHARPGDAVLSPQTLALIADRVTGAPAPDGCMRVEALADPPAPAPDTVAPAPHAAAAMRAFIPAAVRSRLDREDVAWLGELRRISVLFVNLPDFGVDTPIERGQEAMRAVQLALYRFEGSINKLSADDKGASLVAVYGLPPLAHADDPERAARAAVAVRDALAGLGLRAWVGVSTGVAFCGVVGNARRREYTVMGDAVNLAARLMQAAGTEAPGAKDGGVLVCPVTAAEAGGALSFEALTPIRVKGKAAPIAISRPLPDAAPAAAAARPHVRMVGRARERAALAAALDGLRLTRAPQRLALLGDAGMGKSRLTHEALRLARERGFTALLGSADPIETATPYRPWRQVFETLLASGAPMAMDARRAAVLARLPADPAIIRDAPLLEAVLPYDWPQTEFTAGLSGETRARRTRDLLSAVLVDAARRMPLLLALQDAHWFDSASMALLLETLALAAPVAHVISARPFDAGPAGGGAALVAAWTQALDTPGLRALSLGPLSEDESAELARLRLGVRDLPPALSAFLAARSEGNPAFAEEVLISLREAGSLRVEGDRAVLTGDDDPQRWRLPGTMEGLMAARIDRLPPDEQMTMKVASVIGRVFERDALQNIHPVQQSGAVLERHCAMLAQLELTPPVRDTAVTLGVEVAWKFKTNMLKQVAYDRMLFSQRRALHRRMAEWLEAHGRADDPGAAALLAFHWRGAAEDRAPEPEAALTAAGYFGAAAGHALKLHALSEAIALWRDGLALLDRLPPSDARDRAALALLLDMGPALVAAGSYASAEVEQTFDRARALCDAVGQHAELFRALRGLWQVRTGQADYAEAAALATQMAGRAEAADDDALRMEAARAQGFTAFWTADFPAARAALERAVALHDPERSRDLAKAYGQDPLVGAQGLLAWSLAHLDDPDGARAQAAAAERHATGLGHPFSLAYAHGAAMWTNYFVGDRAGAAAAAQRCETLSLERGFPYLAAAGRVVRGWAAADADAVAAASADWRRAGGGIGMPVFLLTEAQLHLEQGRVPAALALLADAENSDKIAREPWLAARWRRLKARADAALETAG